MQLNMKSASSAVILLLALAAAYGAFAGPTATPRQFHPVGHLYGHRPEGVIEYGQIGGAPLQYFVSPKLARACELLKEQKFSTVFPLFYRDLQAHPDSPGDFVALAQASPAWRPLAQRKLERALLKNPDSWILQFEVGTLLFYDWERLDWNIAPLRQDQIQRAEELISSAWRSSNNPLVGLLYDEIKHYTHSGNGSQRFFQDINDRVLRAAAGARAYEVVQRAKQGGWSGPLPSPDLTARSELRPLLGVLIEERADARGFIAIGSPDGKLIYIKRPEPEKAAYLAGWLDLVKEKLAAKPPASGKK